MKLIFYFLCFYTGISEEMSLSYRLYDVEVIELSPQVSFLLMLPPADDLCIVPGQNDEIVERDDFTLLPVQVFEMSKLYKSHPFLL